MKKQRILYIFIFITSSLWAQLHEVGFFVGGSNYIGDIGNEAYFNPNQLGGGILYKRNINTRIALRATYTRLKLIADDADASNIVRKNRRSRFVNTLNELSAGIEFNYFNYDLTTQSQAYTPYLLFELVAFNYSVISGGNSSGDYEYERKTSYAIPFGIGYKAKLFDHFAVAAEIKARYTFVDDLDYNNPKIPSLTFGNPESNDWYVFAGISFVYSFGRPPCFIAPKY
ncbi:MAG: DUF6089 family protein [Flavobacteriaceae bacterium]|nr:DUF6089 family protein [Flavobacteriaceae bacterium]